MGYRGESTIPLNADHNSITKFDSPQDSNYVSVRNILKSLVTGIRLRGMFHVLPYTNAPLMLLGRGLLPAKARADLEQLETLLSVSGNHKDDLQFFRKRWTAGTCGWILDNPLFLEWADEELGTAMLWLHALPASGKSILSSFIIANRQEDSFCVYYFFRFGDQTKRSLSNCLRVLAYQIAEQLPSFRMALRDIRFASKNLEKTDARTIWEKVFVDVLFRMRFTSTQYWIIDALDEADHPRVLAELMQSVFQSLTPIKIILVSRQTPELIATFERCAKVVPMVYLPLEDTRHDIQNFLETEVKHSPIAPELKPELVSRLAAGADGNFLWARLALDDIGECYTQEDLDDTLKGMPSGMVGFYQRMERTLSETYTTRPRDQLLGRAILIWTVCSRRPLSVDELIQALLPISIVMEPSLMIGRVCGQFVVIDSTNHIVMVHQTARDHITSPDSALSINTGEGHEILFAKCMTVLEVRHPHWDPERRVANPPHAERHISGQLATDNSDIVRYATTSWPYHLDRMSSESDAGLTALSAFLKGYSVLAWITALANRNILRFLVPASRSMTLFVRRKRVRYEETNPMLRRYEDLEFIEAWATDLLKIIGKFGEILIANPASIYFQIPPFCPKNTAIYREFDRRNVRPHVLSVEGLTQVNWDDSLARLSLGSSARAMKVVRMFLITFTWSPLYCIK